MPTAFLFKGPYVSRYQSFPPPLLSPPPLPHLGVLITPKSRPTNSNNTTSRKSVVIRAMPGSSSSPEIENNGALRKFKLNESSFLASLMPKKEIGADRFIEAHPEFDGRGVVIAIFDSGVDPAAAGLQVTSDGKPKVLDVIDCTGSGDIDVATVVKADANGCIHGASGASLIINPSWKNPSGDWHVGYKLIYELLTDTLISRLKKERKKKWDEKNQEAIAEAVKQVEEFDQKQRKVDEMKLKRIREDLQDRVDYLKKQAESYDDKGPVIDAVVWHDGEVWRVALDTQSLEDDPKCGRLADFVPLTNYKIERKYGIFSKLDACTFVANVYNEGTILSIVTDSSPHGTHVAGIATAFHPKEPLLNGVAPGAQVISCKIGDSRLGSMETGTGLTRALIAVVEHKCDLINMSYGESTMLPDYGRFVELVDEVVNKYRVVFVSSAGNNGPALTTVGAPGGTTSSIIGVGAYVSPAMAAGAHALVEAPPEGLEYTWSSRGPTADGDLGVYVSAPGGAVAPVPTWTLQRRMLMNGTSMSSPSACGGVALVISAMKAEGIQVSPYSVRKALENTCTPIGCLPEDKLSNGEGLLQIDKAFEYAKKSADLPCVWYKIKISQAGKSTTTLRGIYLREASYCNQSTEWTVQVEPQFHEGTSNLEQLVPFEECIELHSSGKEVVRAPEYLLLTYNGRSFNVVVDPTKLSDGLHYFEVYGIDCRAPWRGPLFRIPITITKPKVVETRPPLVTFSGLSFQPGHIIRKYIEVPYGASWVEATMRTSGFDTARRFYIDTVQLSPLRRPIKWESVAIFSSPSTKSFTFSVEGGRTMELAIAQFWSSGVGSHETAVVDFEIAFHGIDVSKDEVILDGSEAPVRIEAQALLSSEKLAPTAKLNKIRVPYRPTDVKLSALSADRDKLPSGKQILALTLTYKFKLEDGAEVKPQIPLLNNRIYDNKFESQFYMISDSNKRVYAMGDVYPDSAKLPKGEYTLQLHLRHENMQYLEKLKQLVLFIERKLEKEAVQLSFYNQPDGPVTGNGSFKSSTLDPGSKEAFYVGPPTKEKIPKNSPEGSVLLGAISYGKPSAEVVDQGNDPEKNPVSYVISYQVPPPKLDEDKGKSSAATKSTKSVSERLEEEVRDVKIKVLASLKQDTEDEREEWKKLSISLKLEYPKYTPLLAQILEGLVSQEVEDKIHHYEEIIAAADEVVDSIDRDELARFLSVKGDPDEEEFEKTKKKMEKTRDLLVEALYQKGLALVELASLKGEMAVLAANLGAEVVDKPDGESSPDLFEETFKEVQKWADPKSRKYGTLLMIRERHNGRLGTALKVVNEMIQEEGDPPKKQLYEERVSVLEEIGWGHLVTYEKQWMLVRFPPSLPLF
ncbi:tripeptidyl-peptidase 2 isoform X2 [Cynara cardunculus var. scolymus]|uniref:tripeptidyl-peptidase 2 isoform X2 n=1 Tax=Cynara cardunculus var. scolymus TaxID=59895 RepID=UPI000D62B075|nr:tripeptidyl-peptidase 2 isoform X2 [Cynara cardunculus var. scolymus]